MSQIPIATRRYVLHPAATTAYNISDFTASVLESVDQYQVTVENQGTPANAYLSAKSSTAFTITVSVQSPVQQNTVWLTFLRHVDGVVP